MTTNVTHFTMEVGEMLRHDPDEVAKSRSRAKHTWPAIVGFTIWPRPQCGCGARRCRFALVTIPVFQRDSMAERDNVQDEL
jgi:hypothetical protein